MFHYLLQIGQGLLEADKESHAAFAQICKEKLEECPNLLQRTVLSDKCSFSLHGAVNKEKWKICALQRAETYISHRWAFQR